MKNIKIERIDGVPTIIVDNKIITPAFITLRIKSEDKLYIDRDYIKSLGKSGIKVFFVTTDLEWKRKGSNKEFDYVCRIILEEVEDAYIVSRIGLDPPREWIEQNEEECFTYNDGTKPGGLLVSETVMMEVPHVCSLMSNKWREKAGEELIKTLEFYDTLPYSDRIIGTFFCAGGTSEWYYILPMETADLYGDFSLGFKREFIKYLKEKYKTDEKMQNVWQNKSVSLEEPFIYGLNERYFAYRFDEDYSKEPQCVGYEGQLVNIDWKGNLKLDNKYIIDDETHIGSFLNVDRYAGLEDFYKALQITTAESIIYFGKIVKEKYNGNILTGAFFGNICTTIRPGYTNSDGVMKIIESDYIDFLTTPGNYHNRQLGGDTGQRMIHDSFNINNKFTIIEEDTRTHVEMPYYRSLVNCFDIEDTINVLKRDFGRNLSENLYFWWFDQFCGGSRFKFDKVYDLFLEQQKIINFCYNHSRKKHNEIALIYDEESISVVSAEVTNTLNQYFRDCCANRIGTGVDYYYHNDMNNENMPDYKLYIFMNVLELTNDEIDKIHKKLAKNHATALWIYASGFVNYDSEQKLSVKNIKKLTGFEINQIDCFRDTKFRIEKDNKFIDDLSHREIFGAKEFGHYDNLSHSQKNYEAYVNPYFEIKDEKYLNILGRTCLDNKIAFAKKEHKGFTSIYHSSHVLSYKIVRSIAKTIGCHIYSNGNDIIYLGNDFITIHSSESGNKKLYFPKKCSPYEIYLKKYFGKNTNSIDFYLEKGYTLTFYLGNNEI